MASETDAIVKRVLLRAPRERVWRAVSEPARFGAWFGAELDGPFVAGGRLTGRIRPTTVDPEIAKAQAPHAGAPFELQVEAVEPLRRLAFRWHPAGIAEATTRVEFRLEEAEGGVLLTVTESGFDALPPEKRAAAFAGNEQGWAAQCRLIEKYLAGAGR